MGEIDNVFKWLAAHDHKRQEKQREIDRAQNTR